jgi:hypothetical protein
MTTQRSTPHRDLHVNYLAKVNSLISADREDLVNEIIAEYAELIQDDGRQDSRTAA